MSDEFSIPGLIRTPVNVGTEKRPRRQFFFLINLELLTQSVVDGVPTVGPGDTQTKSFWTDNEILQLVCNMGPNKFDAMPAVLRDSAVRNLLDILQSPAAVKLNNNALAFAREAASTNENGQVVESGWHSSLVRANGDLAANPTVLFVPESEVRASSLKKRYEDLVGQRKYRTVRTDAFFLAKLAKFEEDHVDRLRTLQRQLETDLLVVGQVTNRVYHAQLGVVAMFDFAEPAEKRRKIWDVNLEREAGNMDIFAGPLVPSTQEPTALERDKAAKLRDEKLPELYRLLNEMTGWMSTGEADPTTGQTYAPATLRNTAADDLLAALREDDDIAALIENHIHVDRLLWRRVETLLLRCFRLLLIAPNTREKLLAAELGHFATAVAADIPSVDDLDESTARARAVKDAMVEIFSRPVFEGLKSTRLSTLLLSLKSSTDPVVDHRSIVAKLWAVATPSIVDHIERHAKAASHPDPSAFAAGWAWRASFRIADLKKEEMEEAWRKAVLFTAKPTPARAKQIFLVEGLRAENQPWDSATAASAFNMTVALLAAADAMAEHANEKTGVTATNAWIAALKAVQAAPELIATVKETQTFVRIAGGRAKSLISKIGDFADSPAMKALGGVVAVLEVVAAVQAAEEVFASKTTTGEDKDRAEDEVKLAIAGAALAVVGIVGGTALAPVVAVAGAILFVGGAFIRSRAFWLQQFAGIEGLPGPGRAVKLVWQEMVGGFNGGEALMTLANATPYRSALKVAVESLIAVTPESVDEGKGAFWPLTSGNPIIAARAAGAVRRQYGVSLEFAKELVVN